ncbi:MAG: hypothetical protein RLZZ324_114 [Candidatus Parcubacteria bacterium]|jgi:hypothetical protein
MSRVSAVVDKIVLNHYTRAYMKKKVAIIAVAVVGVSVIAYLAWGRFHVSPSPATNVNVATEHEAVKNLSIASATADLKASWQSYDDESGISVSYPSYMTASVYRRETDLQRFPGDQLKAEFAMEIGGPLSEEGAKQRHTIGGPSTTTGTSYRLYFYRGTHAASELVGHSMDDVGISDAERQKYPVQTISSRELKINGASYRLLESYSKFAGQFIELSGVTGEWTIFVQSPRYGSTNAALPVDDETLTLITKTLKSIKIR